MKPEGGAAERNQGTQVVLDVSEGHNGCRTTYFIQTGTVASQNKADNGWNAY